MNLTSERPFSKPNYESSVIQLMIIEDYKLTRVGLCSFLNDDPGLQVIAEAESAEEAIAYLQKTASANSLPQVILMDLGLPGINGIEATEWVRIHFPQIKVIILTSHEREEEVYAALGAGANAYCLKDIDPARLAEVIKSVAEGAAWLDPGVAMMALKLFPKPSNNPSDKAASTAQALSNAQLTEREQEVLKLLVQGKSNTEIAKELVVSVHTAKAHVCSILQKLYVNDRVQAAVKAVQSGLV
jgi:DNA-binding NarL/FixJ family response regulator